MIQNKEPDSRIWKTMWNMNQYNILYFNILNKFNLRGIILYHLQCINIKISIYVWNCKQSH